MSVKKPSSGAGVQNIKERKPVVEYLLTSGGMYLYTIIFSIFGVIFNYRSGTRFCKDSYRNSFYRSRCDSGIPERKKCRRKRV